MSDLTPTGRLRAWLLAQPAEIASVVSEELLLLTPVTPYFGGRIGLLGDEPTHVVERDLAEMADGSLWDAGAALALAAVVDLIFWGRGSDLEWEGVKRRIEALLRAPSQRERAS